MSDRAEHMEYSLHPDVCAMTIGKDAALLYPVLLMHQVHDVRVAVIDDPEVNPDMLDGYDAMITNLQ